MARKANQGIRNLDELRAANPKLYETVTDIIRQMQTVTQQTNSNGIGQPSPPPSVQAVNVTGKNGHFNIAITDRSPLFRDVHYYVEHADNPHFTNPTVIHLGHTRNHNLFLGNVTRYFRAYSAYASSAPGRAAYHGSQVAPLPVTGGGIVGGPEFLDSQGSGTGAPGQGLQGPGTVPFRSTTGIPPTR